MILDARYEKVREDGVIQSQAVLIAIVINWEGKRWLVAEYPALVGDAKRERATIYWGDEMGLRSDHVTGTSYAPLGRTPAVRATGQRFGCT